MKKEINKIKSINEKYIIIKKYHQMIYNRIDHEVK